MKRYRVWIKECIKNKRGDYLDQVDWWDCDTLHHAISMVAFVIGMSGMSKWFRNADGSFSSCWMDYKTYSPESWVKRGEHDVSCTVWVTDESTNTKVELTFDDLRPYLLAEA